jgi:hypothetical protein
VKLNHVLLLLITTIHHVFLLIISVAFVLASFSLGNLVFRFEGLNFGLFELNPLEHPWFIFTKITLDKILPICHSIRFLVTIHIVAFLVWAVMESQLM